MSNSTNSTMAPQQPHATRPHMAWTSAFLNSQIPTMGAMILLLVESARVIPAEFRMWRRAWIRKRLNAAEIMFLLIRYLALIGAITMILLETGAQVFHEDRDCLATSWISQLSVYLSSSIVAASLTWRCYIIFARQRRALYALLPALVGQVVVSLVTEVRQYKTDIVRVDPARGTFPAFAFCDASHPMDNWKPVYLLSAWWFYLANVAFDLGIFSASSYRLLKHARGPTGFARTSALLFSNGVHYCFMICSINFSTLIMISLRTARMPNMLPLSTALTTICGMQLLISEQDAVHGYKGIMSTMVKPATYGGGGGPMTGSMSQSGESKQTLVMRTRPSVSSGLKLGPTARSPARRLPKHHDEWYDDEDDSKDLEQGHGDTKMSFNSSQSHILSPLDPCWTVNAGDAARHQGSSPRTPHTGDTVVSIREIRERMQEQQSNTDLSTQSFNRNRAPSIPPVPKLAPINPRLSRELLSSDSSKLKRPKTSKSDRDGKSHEFAERDYDVDARPLSPFPAPPTWSREPLPPDSPLSMDDRPSPTDVFPQSRHAQPAQVHTPNSAVSAAPSYQSPIDERFSSTWSIVNPARGSSLRAPGSPQRTRTAPASPQEGSVSYAGWERRSTGTDGRR